MTPCQDSSGLVHWVTLVCTRDFQGLIHSYLKNGPTIVVRTIDLRIYHVYRQAAWKSLATSVSYISKGGYQHPLTNLKILI